MVLTMIIHILYVKERVPKTLEEVFLISFNFFYLGGNHYDIPRDTVVTGILDMRLGKHDLHFLVDVELLPHAIVNIPNEAIHIGVFIFIFIIYFIFVIIICFII
jgi:hypothetical protein